MNAFYKITTALNTELKAAGFSVVTIGDYFKADLSRQTIFPYAHIVPQSKSYGTKTETMNSYSFAIIGMDIVDFNKDDLRNEAKPFEGTDNLIDVLNDIDNRLELVVEQFVRGREYDLNIVSYGQPSQDNFMERFENLLAGWELVIELTVPNDTPIC